MELGNPPHERETKTNTRLRVIVSWVGPKQGIENPLGVLWWNSYTLIRDLNGNRVSGGLLPNGHTHRRLRGREGEGIANELIHRHM